MIVQRPLNVSLRVAPQVLAQRTDQLILAESVRRPHAQHPDRFVARAAQLLFQALPLFDQPPRLAVTALAVVGQFEGVSRPLDQFGAQQLLQRLQTPTDRRL
ncbi:Uncharacterised protein [Acinetobacter baumannii]|nr:Uncharacterised protein [Acinetobacter baumannii]